MLKWLDRMASIDCYNNGLRDFRMKLDLQNTIERAVAAELKRYEKSITDAVTSRVKEATREPKTYYTVMRPDMTERLIFDTHAEAERFYEGYNPITVLREVK